MSPYGWIRLPRDDQLVVNVFRDGVGRFYTDHARVTGPFPDERHLNAAIDHCFFCKSLPLEVVQDEAPSPVVTEDPQPQLPPSDEKFVADVAESASALTLQETDALSPEELLDATSSKVVITASPQSVQHSTTVGSSSPSTSSCGSKIFIRMPQNWYQMFCIRMDRGGSFCMYPNLGGPFQSIDEADDAITRYLDELRRRAMSKEQVKLSRVDRLIHNYKYYLDGTPKRGPNSPSENVNVYLMQALLHQYNEDHNLYGNHVHELEAFVGRQCIYENHRWYYHFNFTTKKKEGNGNSSTKNLFFAEMSHMQGETAWDVNCCCMIKYDENGHCYGCRNNGSPDMKHPDNISAYTGGHLDGYLPFGGDEESSDDEEAEVERLRARYKGCDDPHERERLVSLTQKRKVVV